MSNEDNAGMILVTPSGITVSCRENDGCVATTYAEPTIENLCDAARVLAAWMGLSFEDMANECRRLHNREQFDAYLRDIVAGALSEDDPIGQ